jgi:DNA repair protein RadC
MGTASAITFTGAKLTPANLLAYLQRFATLDHEEFRAIFVPGQEDGPVQEMTFAGERDNVSLNPRAIFHHALNIGANGLIFAHNHPGGDPQPSKRDVEITRQMVNICKCLEIPLCDHVIIARQGYFSFFESGLM